MNWFPYYIPCFNLLEWKCILFKFKFARVITLFSKVDWASMNEILCRITFLCGTDWQAWYVDIYIDILNWLASMVSWYFHWYHVLKWDKFLCHMFIWSWRWSWFKITKVESPWNEGNEYTNRESRISLLCQWNRQLYEITRVRIHQEKWGGVHGKFNDAYRIKIFIKSHVQCFTGKDYFHHTIPHWRQTGIQTFSPWVL